METGRDGKAELMGWAVAGLPTTQDLDLAPPRQATELSGSGKPRKLGVKGVDRRKGRRGYCSEPGQEAEAELGPCKQREELC